MIMVTLLTSNHNLLIFLFSIISEYKYIINKWQFIGRYIFLESYEHALAEVTNWQP